jgi:o-succinylbenzoate synthase
VEIVAIELRRLELELVDPVVTAHERHSARPILLVRIDTDLGSGYGECEALLTTEYSGESIDTAQSEVVERMIPKLLVAGGFESGFAAAESLDTQRAPMAGALLEMALIDAELRFAGRSLASWLGARRTSIAAGATVGIGDLGDTLQAARRAARAGFSRIKLKVSPGQDVQPLKAIRSELPAVVLTADANGSYELADRSHRELLSEMDALQLAAIEQPLAASDLDGLVRITEEFSTPVLLDESAATLADIERAIDVGAGAAMVIKPARLGGISKARRARDVCVQAGLGLAIGGLFEAGVGRAASLAVAAMDGFDLPGDLGPSDRYFEEDITVPHVMEGGSLAVPSGAGLGVELRSDVIDERTSKLLTFGRS